MPLWVYAIQVLAMLAVAYVIFGYTVALYLGAAFGGWHWSDIRHVAAIAALIVLLGFMLYNPDALWRLFQMVPLPPAPTIETYR